MKPEDFIGDSVRYCPLGQHLYGRTSEGEHLIGEVRGWGNIQYLFKSGDAEHFQDELGEWIADAINMKLQAGRSGQNNE